MMKLESWQREKLAEFLKPIAWRADESVDEMIEWIEELLDAEPQLMDDEAIYKRFMAEWKQVGVWAGGKPVRVKLKRIVKAGQIGEVWAGLERLRNDPNRPAPEYVPRPMTWLNQERWNDDPYPAKSGGRQAAAGAVLDIQLQSAGPSIMGELQQGRW